MKLLMPAGCGTPFCPCEGFLLDYVFWGRMQSGEVARIITARCVSCGKTVTGKLKAR